MNHQAIKTKYLGPTNHRGARIKAMCDAGSITTPYEYGIGVEANHKRAATALLHRLEWSGRWESGSLDKGFCFVCTERLSHGLYVAPEVKS